MKNFKLLLATAVLFAVGSAFTVSNKALVGEYILGTDGTFRLKSTQPAGHCENAQQEICDYTKVNLSGNDTDPANFTPNHTDAEWVED